MKSIISGAVVATAIVALTLNLQAKSVNHLAATVKTMAVSDTGKMAKSKMSKKKMSKMSGDKMSKKKMSKDSTGKM